MRSHDTAPDRTADDLRAMLAAARAERDAAQASAQYWMDRATALSSRLRLANDVARCAATVAIPSFEHRWRAALLGPERASLKSERALLDALYAWGVLETPR